MVFEMLVASLQWTKRQMNRHYMTVWLMAALLTNLVFLISVQGKFKNPQWFHLAYELFLFSTESFKPSGSVTISTPPKNFVNLATENNGLFWLFKKKNSNSENSDVGATATFDFATEPCLKSRRYLLNYWQVSEKRSQAAAVLQVSYFFSF